MMTKTWVKADSMIFIHRYQRSDGTMKIRSADPHRADVRSDTFNTAWRFNTADMSCGTRSPANKLGRLLSWAPNQPLPFDLRFHYITLLDRSKSLVSVVSSGPCLAPLARLGQCQRWKLTCAVYSRHIQPSNQLQKNPWWNKFIDTIKQILSLGRQKGTNTHPISRRQKLRQSVACAHHPASNKKTKSQTRTKAKRHRTPCYHNPKQPSVNNK